MSATPKLNILPSFKFEELGSLDQGFDQREQIFLQTLALSPPSSRRTLRGPFETSPSQFSEEPAIINVLKKKRKTETDIDEISTELLKSPVMRDFFKGKPTQMIRNFCKKLTYQFLPMGNYLFKKNDPSAVMYVVIKGTILILDIKRVATPANPQRNTQSTSSFANSPLLKVPGSPQPIPAGTPVFPQFRKTYSKRLLLLDKSGSNLSPKGHEPDEIVKEIEEVINTVTGGQILGERGILMNHPRSTSALSKTDCYLACITKKDFEIVTQDNIEKELMNKAKFIHLHMPGAKNVYSLNDMLRVAVYVFKSQVFPKDSYVIRERSRDNPMFMIIQKGECEILKDINYSDDPTSVKFMHRESFSIVGEGSLIGGEPSFLNRPHSYSVKVKSPELIVLTMNYDLFNIRMKDMEEEIKGYINERCTWMKNREDLIKSSKRTFNSMTQFDHQDSSKPVPRSDTDQTPRGLSHATALNKRKMLLSIKRKETDNLVLNKLKDKLFEEKKKIELNETQKLKARLDDALQNQFTMHDSKPLSFRSTLNDDSPFNLRKSSTPVIFSTYSSRTSSTSDLKALEGQYSKHASSQLLSPLSLNERTSTFYTSRKESVASPPSSFGEFADRAKLAFRADSTSLLPHFPLKVENRKLELAPLVESPRKRCSHSRVHTDN